MNHFAHPTRILARVKALEILISHTNHILRQHFDYDYDDYDEYRKATKKAEEIVDESTIELNRLNDFIEQNAEYFI